MGNTPPTTAQDALGRPATTDDGPRWDDAAEPPAASRLRVVARTVCDVAASLPKRHRDTTLSLDYAASTLLNFYVLTNSLAVYESSCEALAKHALQDYLLVWQFLAGLHLHHYLMVGFVVALPVVCYYLCGPHAAKCFVLNVLFFVGCGVVIQYFGFAGPFAMSLGATATTTASGYLAPGFQTEAPDRVEETPDAADDISSQSMVSGDGGGLAALLLAQLTSEQRERLGHLTLSRQVLLSQEVLSLLDAAISEDGDASTATSLPSATSRTSSDSLDSLQSLDGASS
jgi:hypothetical protein